MVHAAGVTSAARIRSPVETRKSVVISAARSLMRAVNARGRSQDSLRAERLLREPLPHHLRRRDVVAAVGEVVADLVVALAGVHGSAAPRGTDPDGDDLRGGPAAVLRRVEAAPRDVAAVAARPHRGRAVRVRRVEVSVRDP